MEIVKTQDYVPVVRCKDCCYCRPLKTTPGFFCTRLERNLYAPHYEDSAWYCADGERRGDDGKDA